MMCREVLIVLCLLVFGSVYGDHPLQRSARFDVEAGVMIGGADAGARSSWRILGSLAVKPRASAPDGLLLEFNLDNPKLSVLGTGKRADYKRAKSDWDEETGAAFYAHWQDGAVLETYFEPREKNDMVNFKKSLISLFQFQLEEGDFNETDVSGDCDVHYHNQKDGDEVHIKKFKRQCWWAGQLEQNVRRGGALVIKKGALEEASWQDEAKRGALMVRSWLRLVATSTSTAPLENVASVRGALPPGLKTHSLPLLLDDATELPDEWQSSEPLSKVIDQEREELEQCVLSGGGTGASGGRCLDSILRVAAAARVATREQIERELLRDENREALPLISVSLALSPSPAPELSSRHVLLSDVTRVSDAAAGYLATVAATRGTSQHSHALARLAKIAGDQRLRAAAAMAACPVSDNPCPAADKLRAALANCADIECTRAFLRVIAAFPDTDTNTLLKWVMANNGTELIALDEISRRLEKGSLEFTTDLINQMERVALGLHADVGIEVRSAALDILLLSSAQLSLRNNVQTLPIDLHALQKALDMFAPTELAWRFRLRLRVLADRYNLITLPDRWDSPRGLSLLLSRSLGALRQGALTNWGGRLHIDALLAGGALRRGVVRIAGQKGEEKQEFLAVELYATGLHTLGGEVKGNEGLPEVEEVTGGIVVCLDGAAGPHTQLFSSRAGVPEDEEATGGIVVGLGGAAGPHTQLFSSRAGLLGALWSGGEGGSVLRAATGKRGGGGVPVCGGAVVRYQTSNTAFAAMDAGLTVSLWSRAASGRVQVTAPSTLHSYIQVHQGGLTGGAAATERVHPLVSVTAALDFYDKPVLCTAVDCKEYQHSINTTSWVQTVDRVVRRTKTVLLTEPGKTFSLGPDNDRACIALPPTEEPS